MQAAARLRIAAAGNGGVPHINAPTDLSGLVGWWDASAITGHVDGDKLSSWTDSSAGSGAVVQATGTKQPTYNTGIQNGLPVVTFAGAQTMAVAGTTRSAPYTVLQVLKITTPGATTQIGFDGGTAGLRAALYCNSGKVEMYEGLNNDASTLHSAAAPVSFPTGATLLAGVFAGVASGNSTDQGAICRVNRTSYFVNGPISTQSLAPITLGSQQGGFSFLTGWIAETVVYSRALSLTEVKSVENYLHSKWATT